jgi:hypothetical protein
MKDSMNFSMTLEHVKEFQETSPSSHDEISRPKSQLFLPRHFYNRSKYISLDSIIIIWQWIKKKSLPSRVIKNHLYKHRILLAIHLNIMRIEVIMIILVLNFSIILVKMFFKVYSWKKYILTEFRSFFYEFLTTSVFDNQQTLSLTLQNTISLLSSTISWGRWYCQSVWKNIHVKILHFKH